MHLGEVEDVFWMGKRGGRSWCLGGDVAPCAWGKVFLHRGSLYWRSRGRGCTQIGFQKTGDPKAGKLPKGKEVCPAGGTCLLWEGHSCPAPSLGACLWSWEPSVPLPYLQASAWGLETVCWHHVLLSRWASAFVPARVFQRGWLWCGISVIVASTEKKKPEGKASPVLYHLLCLPLCGPHPTPK